ncbi:CpaF family protein [Heliorestis convoluta]|uniref:Type II secretion system protein E n=1 Tax=Heliorestis convoluta TaxID=356322 RepID=A0A5Q2N8I9_9FIRM|nr:CpaF family protein [Heliorestis convoluta]QGG48570.1 Type II secretion system protein E [Heliorestis convoluta]
MEFSSGNPNLKDSLNNKTKKKDQGTQVEDIHKTVTENVYHNSALVTVQRKLISQIDATLVPTLKSDTAIGAYLEMLLDDLVAKEFPSLSRREREVVLHSVLDELRGFGPLEHALMDDSISEIMVNGPHQVYIEKKGRLEVSEIKFRDDKHVLQIIDKIVAPLGRRIDESSPMVDARLPNGSRVNAVIPPISLKGPLLTIRKFSSKPITIEKLIQYGSLNEAMSLFLSKAVKAKANIMVAGGTGSGKSTLLNTLSSFIPEGERIITIEDAAELKLLQPHVISLEARPPNIEGKGAITIKDLVRNSLRMRPDRIIVGEVRGAETLDMLQAMNTGHNGSLSTVHANSPRDALSRLETMTLYAGIDLPLRAIREQIHSAIDLICFIERMSDGTRKVTHITEIAGMGGDSILLQDLYYFNSKDRANGKVRGEFVSTDLPAKIEIRFRTLGIEIKG